MYCRIASRCCGLRLSISGNFERIVSEIAKDGKNTSSADILQFEPKTGFDSFITANQKARVRFWLGNLKTASDWIGAFKEPTACLAHFKDHSARLGSAGLNPKPITNPTPQRKEFTRLQVSLLHFNYRYTSEMRDLTSSITLKISLWP